MSTNIELFHMLEAHALAALDRDRLEAELTRVHQMLDRVADYQRAVLAAITLSEKA